MRMVTAYRLRWSFLSGASEIGPNYWRDRAKAQAHAESAMSGEEMVHVAVEAVEVPEDTQFLDGAMARSDVLAGIAVAIGASLIGPQSARRDQGGRGRAGSKRPAPARAGRA